VHVLFGCIRFSFCCDSLVCFFCVSLHQFGFVFSNLVLLVFLFQYQAQRLAGKNVFDMTFFASSGT